jgi:hypothetical protein
VFWAKAPVATNTAAAEIRNSFFMIFSWPLNAAQQKTIRQEQMFRENRNSLPLFPVILHRGNATGKLEEIMKLRTIAAAALIAAFATPALAADEFFVVQDAKTKKCTIVDKKPVDTSTTVVSPSGTVYKSRTEAEAGMKTVKVCSSN